MNKKEAILLTIVLLAGISLLGTGCQTTEPTGTAVPFIGGTSGLVMSFTAEAPPKEVYDGGAYPFDIVVQLTNEGEWDVAKESATLRVSGLDPLDFSLTNADLVKQPLEDLTAGVKEPDTGTVIKGTTTTVEFTGFNFKGTVPGNIPKPLIVDVCYTYGTRAVSQLCIRKDPTDASNTVCKVEEDKIFYSSSAPVQVTNVHQSLRGKSIVGFTFTIEKKGVGDVFQKESKCDTVGIQYENKVWVEVIVPEMSGVKCTGMQGGTDSTGYVTLYSSGDKTGGLTRTISCTQPAPTETDYTKDIKINLVYDYKEDIRTSIIIKHTAG
jgi:hypothetical protein